MEIRRLSESSITGIKWVVFLYLLGSIFSYGINILLGKISPQVLGTYGLLMVFSSLVPTFLLFGGNQVIVRFLPTIHTRKKLNFVASYSVLVLALASMAFFCVKANPAFISHISERGLEAGLLPYLAFLIPILLLLQISTATLWAQMEIKWMKICQKSNSVLIFLGSVLLYLLRGRLGQEMVPRLVVSLVLASFTLSMFLALYQVFIKITVHFPLNIELFFPPGFWKFAAAIQLGIVFWFILERFDQALVWSQLSVSDLGLYRAPLATAEVVRWIPLASAQVAFPLFANLLARGNDTRVAQAYGIFTRYSTLATSAVSLPLILFSREVLALFGKSYLEGDVILNILASVFILSAISTINTSLLVAHGRASLIILNGLVPSSVQILAALLLVGRFGLMSVAIGRALALVSYALANSWMVAKLWRVKPHRQAMLILAMDVAVIALSQLIVTPHFFLKLIRNAVLLGGFALGLVTLGIFGKEDLQFFVKLLLGRYHESGAGLLRRLVV
jgi:O-antigen/teichoic acid export membrane protein